MDSISETDEGLVTRARGGDMDALDALVRRHQSWIFNLALRMVWRRVALAGLVPRKKDSGTSVHTAPRLSKMGSRLLRQTLYMAALAALRHNPLIRALGQRLKAKGKGGKRAVVAAMRKLVRLIYGVLKQGKPFDPNWEKRDRAVGLGGRASVGDERPSPQLAAPAVATA